MKKLYIGFFGDGPWSHKALDKLLNDDSLQVAFICARHPHPDPILKKKSTDYTHLYIKSIMKKLIQLT